MRLNVNNNRNCISSSKLLKYPPAISSLLSSRWQLKNNSKYSKLLSIKNRFIRKLLVEKFNYNYCNLYSKLMMTSENVQNKINNKRNHIASLASRKIFQSNNYFKMMSYNNCCYLNADDFIVNNINSVNYEGNRHYYPLTRSLSQPTLESTYLYFKLDKNYPVGEKNQSEENMRLNNFYTNLFYNYSQKENHNNNSNKSRNYNSGNNNNNNTKNLIHNDEDILSSQTEQNFNDDIRYLSYEDNIFAGLCQSSKFCSDKSNNDLLFCAEIQRNEIIVKAIEIFMNYYNNSKQQQEHKQQQQQQDNSNLLNNKNVNNMINQQYQDNYKLIECQEAENKWIKLTQKEKLPFLLHAYMYNYMMSYSV